MAVVNIVANGGDPIEVKSSQQRALSIVSEASTVTVVQKKAQSTVVVKAVDLPGFVHISKRPPPSISITRISSVGIQAPPYYGYELQNGPEYTEAFAYVGFVNDGGGWFVYRRNRLTNERLYMYGEADYAAAWADRENLNYGN